MKTVFPVLVALALLPLQSNAALVELNSGALGGTADGEGDGRGIGFQALSDFSITSLGIFGDLIENEFDVQVYASTTGSDAGDLLASESAIRGGNGNGWYDIDIDFSFVQDEFYVLYWRPSEDTGVNWAHTLDYYRDDVLPVSIEGLAMLINGVDGYNPDNFINFFHPNLRINVEPSAIPIPAAVWLFGSALLGLVGYRRRNRAS